MMSARIRSQAELSRRSGVPQPTIHRILNGTGRPTMGVVEELAKALKVPYVWLLMGVDYTQPELPDGSPAAQVDGHVQIRKVKLRLSAGISGFQIDPEYDEVELITIDPRWIAKRGLNASKLIAIDVKGDSMEPTLYDGDTVILDTSDTEPVDGVVFAVNYEGEDVVKRLVRDAGSWWLSSDSLDQRRHARKLCEGGGCLIIGKVVRRESDRI